jgi:hypothetical protein
MHDEDTGEEPRCVICGSLDDCEHLVACIDRTFGECEGGALYYRDGEFWSKIEMAFIVALKSGIEKKWHRGELEELWDYARNENDVEEKYVGLDKFAFIRLLVELLEDAGAIRRPGAWVTDGGPGMSSSYSLLYAEKPNAVIGEALKGLRAILIEPPIDHRL